MADDLQPRYQLHGFVSARARDGWYDFCDREGVNVTAMLEAVGLLLGESYEAAGVLADVVKEAQRVASARSSRRRTDRSS